MQNPNDVTRLKHLDSLASKVKDYTRNNSGGGAVNVFTGATSLAGGASGLVPEPAAGDNDKFLRGDGTWAAFTLDTIPSTVEGAMWLEI